MEEKRCYTFNSFLVMWKLLSDLSLIQYQYVSMIYIDLYIARVELFNGKGGLVEGRIESIDRSGVDFEAVENPKLVSPPTTQWHVFAAFSEFLEN